MSGQLIRPVSLIEKIAHAVLTTAMISVGAYELVNIVTDFSNQWYWLFFAGAYTIIINETFTHRVCGHKTFKVNVKSFTFKVLTWLSSVDLSYGPARMHAITHLMHHAYSDQKGRDPINIREFWWGAAIASPLSQWGSVNCPNSGKLFEFIRRDFNDILNDRWAIFCEKYAVVISLSTQIFLFFVAPIFLLKVLLPGRILMTLFMVLDGFCHLRQFPLNYRNTNTRDESSNNLVLHYMLLGMFNGMMENNHHARPNDISANKRWYEIDTLLPVLYLFRLLMGKKSSTLA